MSTQPTNADILELIKIMHKDLSSRMASVENQAKITNGRITKLEKANLVTRAIEEYKKEHSNDRSYRDIDWKYLLGIGTVVAAALIAIGKEIGKNQ